MVGVAVGTRWVQATTWGAIGALCGGFAVTAALRGPEPSRSTGVALDQPAVDQAFESILETAPASAGFPENVVSSGNLDPTVLTSFISVSAFEQNTAFGGSANNGVGHCIAQISGSPLFVAPIQLPDGAVIKRLRAFGYDQSTTGSANLALWRTQFDVPSLQIGDPVPSDRSSEIITGVNTGGSNAPGDFVLSTAELNELTGSFRTFSIGEGQVDHHRSYSVQIGLGPDANVCGVEVDYQVRAPADPGTSFFPVTPYRAYDSRREMSPVADGVIDKNQTRIIPVDDARDIATGAITTTNAIPANATAVAYTVTVVGAAKSGFLFIAPASTTGITASSINWGPFPGGAIANSSTVQIDDNQIKVFAGEANGSTHFIIDITGYYATAAYPNMGN